MDTSDIEYNCIIYDRNVYVQIYKYIFVCLQELFIFVSHIK